ncbi:Fur family transcriptional regulator [Chloroflexota bacterium]
MVNRRRKLGAAGMRATNQRALILDIISRGGRHLDADEIYRRARAKLPRLSLSTVYRSLQRFQEMGLIEKLHFDDEHHHYEVRTAAEHHHLVCLGCDEVVEFPYALSRYLKRNVPEVKGFGIVSAEMKLTGYCPECCRKRE